MRQFLFLFLIFTASRAIAQEATPGIVQLPAYIEHKKGNLVVAGAGSSTIPTLEELTGGKTAANIPTWFRFSDIMFQPGVSEMYENVVYEDTNLVYQSAGGARHTFIHGMGMSFDPTDSCFFSDASMGTIWDYDYVPPFRVKRQNLFQVDSIAFRSKYRRNKNVTDSLIIYVAKITTAPNTANPLGLYDLQFTVTLRRFLSAWFDSTNSELSSMIPEPDRQRIAIPLDSAYHADTNALGFSNMTGLGIRLNTMISCSPGETLLAYVMFKSGIVYPNETPVDSANYLLMYSYDINGTGTEDRQNRNSYLAGLRATKQLKYEYLGGDFVFEGKSILFPNVGDTVDGYWTDMAFHVQCVSCHIGIDEVSGKALEAKVYPNPADKLMTIRYKSAGVGSASLMVTDVTGRIVLDGKAMAGEDGQMHVETATMTEGVYFYILQTEDSRAAGKFVVKH